MRGAIHVEKMLYTSNFSPWKIWSFVQIGWFWNPWSAPLSGLAVAKVCCGFARTSLHHLWITALKFDRNPKQMGLDHESWSNFHPTSNHPFFYTKRAAFWNQVFQVVQMFFSGCAVCVSQKKNIVFLKVSAILERREKSIQHAVFLGGGILPFPPKKKYKDGPFHLQISSANHLFRVTFLAALCCEPRHLAVNTPHPLPVSGSWNRAATTTALPPLGLLEYHYNNVNLVILHLFYIPSLELT